MNLSTVVKNLNRSLETMDEKLAQAKRSMGIRPDLAMARAVIHEVDDALAEAAMCILLAQRQKVSQPPDVIAHVNRVHREMFEVATEIDMCSAIIADRTPHAAALILN